MKLLMIITSLMILFMVSAVPVSADSQPVLPHYFYGTVTIDGNPAPAGTVIEARVPGVINGTFNPITAVEAGQYGSPNPLVNVPRLLVQGDIADGAIVEFFVNGIRANETSTWHSSQIEMLNLTVTMPPALTITTASLPDGMVGTAYSQVLMAVSGSVPYTWAVIAGTLPSGLGLDPDSGVISGTPTAAGTASFTVEVTDSASATDTQELSITIMDAPPLSIITDTLAEGTAGVAYSQTLVAENGAAPYTWLVTAGSLPEGLSLNSANGHIFGTPASAGTASFTVQVTDSLAATATQDLTIVIHEGGPLTITTLALPNGTVGVSYSRTLRAQGGTAPYTWAVTAGALPSGLGLDPDSGVISGTPETVGTTDFTVQVTDNVADTVVRNLSITINAQPVGGGGIGGGSSGAGDPTDRITVTTPGLTGTVPIVNRSGILQNDVTLVTPDNLAVLTIAAGTKMIIDSGDSPVVTSITAVPAAVPPDPPPGKIIVLAYSFGPNKAQFSPPLKLTMKYNPAELPPGVEPGDLTIAWWDGTEWVNLDSNIDPATNTIVAKVEHFTEFALLAGISQPTLPPTTSPAALPATTTAPQGPSAPSLAPTVSSPSPVAPAVTGQPLPGTPATQPANLALIIGLTAGVLLIAGIIAFTLLRRNAKR